jgi:hypothetical protein
MAEEEEEIDSERCPICYELLGQIDPVKINVCGHNFHYRCLKKYYNSQGMPSSLPCPFCRTPFNIKDDLVDLMYELQKPELINQLEEQKLKLITKLDKKEIQSIQDLLVQLNQAASKLKEEGELSMMVLMSKIPLEFHKIIQEFFIKEGKEVLHYKKKVLEVVQYAIRTIEDYLIERKKREGMSDSEKLLGGGESYSKGGGGKSRKQKRTKRKLRKSRKSRKLRKLRKSRKIKRNKRKLIVK